MTLGTSFYSGCSDFPIGELYQYYVERLKSLSTNPQSLLLTVTAIAILMVGSTILKRLYFHPLSQIPGPRIAAMTSWYEFYFNVIYDGEYVKRFAEMHKIYNSPVIRVSPNHVHVNDPDFFNKVFQTGTRYHKDPRFYTNIGITEALLCICEPQKHRIHQSVISPLFSAKAMEIKAPRVVGIVEKAAEQLIHSLRKGEPINIQRLYYCITADLICQTLFGHCQNLVESEDLNKIPELLEAMEIFTKRIWIGYYFPYLARLALKLPASAAKKVAPGFVHFQEECKSLILGVAKRRKMEAVSAESEESTIFNVLLEPSADMKYKTPPLNDLMSEAFTFLLAGTDTTAVLSCLQKELDEATLDFKTKSGLQNIQKLPYLAAMIKEVLRLATAIPNALPRIVPPEGVMIQSQYIPGGTIISINQRVINEHPSIFPDPKTFKPERWLGEQGKALEAWNVAYSKGPRRCVGSLMAQLEMSVCFAYFFSRFELKLYNTDASTVDWVDHGIAATKKDVKVVVKQDHWATAKL